MTQADGGARGGDRLDDALLDRRRRHRRHPVDRFFEERTVERVRLVDDGQRLQRSVSQQAFNRVFRAGNERLDQHVSMRLVSFEPNVARRKQATHPLERGEQLLLAVHTNNTSTARERQRFDDRGITKSRRNRGGIGVNRRRNKPRASANPPPGTPLASPACSG